MLNITKMYSEMGTIVSDVLTSVEIENHPILTNLLGKVSHSRDFISVYYSMHLRTMIIIMNCIKKYALLI